MSKAREDIAAERRRQIEIEGWTPEHDDGHDGGELLNAGMCYFAHAMGRAVYRPDGTPMGWPWDAAWWKPKDKRSDLVRAGALCLADKERIQRRSASLSYATHVEQKLDLIAAEIERMDQSELLLS